MQAGKLDQRISVQRLQGDLLRLHHERIEAWILEQAGVKFDRDAELGKLRMVAGGSIQ